LPTSPTACRTSILARGALRKPEPGLNRPGPSGSKAWPTGRLPEPACAPARSPGDRRAAGSDV